VPWASRDCHLLSAICFNKNKTAQWLHPPLRRKLSSLTLPEIQTEINHKKNRARQTLL